MQTYVAKAGMGILKNARLVGFIAVLAALTLGLAATSKVAATVVKGVKASVVVVTPVTPAAFPGAVGFGSVATGSRGSSAYEVYHVTNLNDSGTGSFRDAVAHHGRIVVFDVGGYIHLLQPVSASYNLTICGQTAPGGGIGVWGAQVSFTSQSNCIIRDLRFRDGTLDPNYSTSAAHDGANDCVGAGDAQTMIFDHCSFEFAGYNNIDATGNGTTSNLTFQNCLFADPILPQQFNFHLQGNDFTFIDNIFANVHNRNPLAKANLQYVNNTIYDYEAGFTTGDSSGAFNWDLINNYFITGPGTSNANDDWFQIQSPQSAYAIGNYMSNTHGSLSANTANSTGAKVLGSYFFNSTNTPANPTASLPTVTAEQSVFNNLANAGALPRDDVDTQVINQVASLGLASLGNGSGAGRIFNTQTDTGLPNSGYGTGPVSGTNPTDTSGDGIADYWKTAVLGITNLNNVVGPTPLASDGSGYTKLEEYVNWLAVPHAIAQEDSSVQIDLSQYTAGLINPTFTVTSLLTGTAILPVGIGAGQTQNTGSVSVSGSTATYTPESGTVGLGGFTFTAMGTNGTITNTVYVCTAVSANTPATVTLSNLTAPYTGSPQAVTVTTDPANLGVSVTYTGISVTYPTSTTPPTAAGTYTVVATVTDPDYEGSATGTFTISTSGLTFPQWMTYYSTTGAATTPENDGVSNAFKYVFDINPSRHMTAADRAALPTVGNDTTTTPGTQYLTLTYRLYQYALATGGIAVNVQTSPDLQTWTTVTPDLSQQTGTDPTTGDPIMKVGVIIPANTTPAFIRLNITNPTTLNTVPEGILNLDLPAASTTYLSVPLTSDPSYRGVVSSSIAVTANTIAVDDSPAPWTAGALANLYFVKFLSGNEKGRVLLVTANTASSLTLATTDNSMQTVSLTTSGFNVLAGDAFEVFPADTLASRFGANTTQNPLVLTGGTYSSADTVGIYSPSLFKFQSYYFNTTAGYWELNGSTANANNTILYPYGALTIFRRGTDLSYTEIGRVAEVPVHIKAATNAVAYSSSGYPLNLTLSQINLGPNWQESSTYLNADILSLGTPSGFVSYFELPNSTWQAKPSSTDQSTVIVPAGDAISLFQIKTVSGAASFVSPAMPYTLSNTTF